MESTAPPVLPGDLRQAGEPGQAGGLDHHGERPELRRRAPGGTPRRGRRRVLGVSAPQPAEDLGVDVLRPGQGDPHRAGAEVPREQTAARALVVQPKPRSTRLLVVAWITANRPATTLCIRPEGSQRVMPAIPPQHQRRTTGRRDTSRPYPPGRRRDAHVASGRPGICAYGPVQPSCPYLGLGSHVRGEEQPDQGAVLTGHHHPGYLGMAHPVRQRGGIFAGAAPWTRRIASPSLSQPGRRRTPGRCGRRRP